MIMPLLQRFPLKLFFVACLLLHSANSFQAPELIARWFVQSRQIDSEIDSETMIRLRPSPLIGGPKWLPLHVQLVIDNQYVWDFVPLNAKSPATLRNLVLLQSVPAEIRCLVKPKQKDETISSDTTAAIVRLQRQATLYAESYTDTHLHLLKNNCWTFAFAMLLHLLLLEGGQRDDGLQS